MATGTVSSVTGDVFQQIATTTVTSGSEVNFTSISGYKTLMVVFNRATLAAGNGLWLEFNGDTANNYGYTTFNGTATNSYFYACVLTAASGADIYSGNAVIKDVNNTSIVKTVESTTNANSNGSAGRGSGTWNSTAAITSVKIYTFSTFTAGAFTLYGIAA